MPVTAPQQYQTSTGRPTDNYSVGGAVLAGCQTQWASNGRGIHTRLVVWCGRNDINGGTSGATLWTAYLSFVLSVQAQGVEVVAVTLAPWGQFSGWSAAKQTEDDSFNASLISYQSTHLALRLVDSRPCLWDPAVHNNLLAANNSGDGLHLSATGATTMGGCVAAAVP